MKPGYNPQSKTEPDYAEFTVKLLDPELILFLIHRPEGFSNSA